MAALLQGELSRRRFLSLTALVSLAKPWKPHPRQAPTPVYPDPALFPALDLYPMG